MTSTLSDKPHSNKEARLEKTRRALSLVLGSLVVAGTLTRKEADAIEAAMEDELIAIRVRGLR